MQHILVVDDEMQVGTLFKRFLELKGYRVSMAHNGENALQIYHDDPADAVVTDFCMPGMNGRELLSRIRERKPDLPAIIVSGYVHEPGLGNSRTAVFNKPVNLSVLTQRLQDLLATGQAVGN